MTDQSQTLAVDRAELARLEAEFEAAGGRGPELADRIDALRARVHALAGPWRAVVSGRAGFVITDEQMREWAQDADSLDEDLEPAEVSVVRHTALPRPAPIDAERMPGTWAGEDVLYLLDVADEDVDDVLVAWERAQAVAAALNALDAP